ncbi:MAG: metallophosphoesterase family protein [Thermodesulfobacteriota bacterium]
MKIGVISDTHLRSPSPVLIRIIEETFKGCDLILHAGDLVTGRVLTYLEAHGVTAVRGNMDLPEVTAALPAKRVIEAGGFQIGLIHGFGAPRGLAEVLRREFDRIDCLVFGHSHEPLNKKVGRELWFNPGTAGGSYRRGATVGLLQVGKEIKGEIITIE